jgi:thymidylate kinase
VLIVLEGVDGAGKTTLAQRMVAAAELRGYEAEIWHRGVPVRHPLQEYELDLELDYGGNTERRLIVCDRWHLGQIVYGELYRNDLKDSNLGTTWHVDALLQAYGAMQLVVSPPLDIVKSRLEQRGEDYLQPEHVGYVHQRYEELADFFGKSITTIRDAELSDSDLNVLMLRAVCRSAASERLRPFGTYVGPRDPELLLLGDAHANGPMMKDAPPHRAAFVPYGHTSGRWLCDSIVSSPLAFQRVGIANAAQEDVAALLDVLGQPKVVAMGQVADQRVTDLGIDHGAVPHPQYMRRFFNSYKIQYTKAIAKAADNNEKVQPWLI